MLVTFLTRGFSTTGHAGPLRGRAEIAGAMRVLVSVLLVCTTVLPPSSSGRRAPGVERLRWRPSAARAVRPAPWADSEHAGSRALGTFGLGSGSGLADAEVAEKAFAVGYYRALAREAAAARSLPGPGGSAAAVRVRGRSG